MRIVALFVVSLALAACVQTASETPGTFVFEGRSFDTVTREFVRSDGSTFQRRSIRYGSRFVSCSATDDRDCEGAIRDARAQREGF